MARPKSNGSSSTDKSSVNLGFEADFGPEPADTFRRDLLSNLRADFVLAIRPSNTPIDSARTTMCAGSSASRPRATPTSPGRRNSSITSRQMKWLEN
jgi:hypothetical protein